MKKLLIILLISISPIIAISQSIDSKNWKHTGTNEFTKTVTIQTKTLTGTKITALEELMANRADTLSINDIITIPTIFQAAGDTSNYHTPGKVGNIFINTTAGKVYISKSALRNGWLILN